VPAQGPARCAQRHHLGVGGRITKLGHPVDTGPDDLAAGHDNRAEWQSARIIAITAGQLNGHPEIAAISVV
jgi:hypothetical protein